MSNTTKLFDIPSDSTLNAGSANSIEFSVAYQKEGHNWGTGAFEKGGFFLYFSFVTISGNCRTSTLYGDDSFKCNILEAKRNNAKKREKLLEAFDYEAILAKCSEGKQAVANEIFKQAAELKI